jgi:putative redox protein
MSVSLNLIKSKIEFEPVCMTLNYQGGMSFTATTQKGQKISIDAHAHLGGSGSIPNPIDYLLASLGGCVGIKILLALSDNSITPDTLNIEINGTRKQNLPAIFEDVHIHIEVDGPIENKRMDEILDRTMNLVCPIAAMFVELAKVTWDYQIIKPN